MHMIKKYKGPLLLVLIILFLSTLIYFQNNNEKHIIPLQEQVNKKAYYMSEDELIRFSATRSRLEQYMLPQDNYTIIFNKKAAKQAGYSDWDITITSQMVESQNDMVLGKTKYSSQELKLKYPLLYSYNEAVARYHNKNKK